MLIWIGFLVRGSDPNKASWLLLPLTAIYVVTNIWVAAGAVRSANAASATADIMRQTLSEMRLQTDAMYAPIIGFPEGLKCWFKPDGTAEVILTNLSNQPALGLRVYLWEMELNQDGQKECKYSSLRESTMIDLPGGVAKQVFVLPHSVRTDGQKTQDGLEASKIFFDAYGKPPKSTLCAVTYYTKISSKNKVFVYDLEMVHPK